MKWNEMKWNEMKWNEMQWNAMQCNAMQCKNIFLDFFKTIFLFSIEKIHNSFNNCDKNLILHSENVELSTLYNVYFW